MGVDYPGGVFSKKSKEPQPVTTPAPEASHASAPAHDKTKSGPTPRRKVQEAANKVPLVPTDRRAAAKTARAAQRAQRDIEYKAMLSGDEANLPARDRGRERRFVRDFVDARWNLGEVFLFVALAMMVVIMFVGSSGSPDQIAYTTIVLYLIVLVTMVDGWLMWRRLKKALQAKFGPDVLLKPLRWYAVGRAFQMRRARLPKPQVKHGQYPS